MSIKLHLAFAVLAACCLSRAASRISFSYVDNTDKGPSGYWYITSRRENKNVNQPATDPSTFFQRANDLPFDMYNNYMCSMFGSLSEGNNRVKRDSSLSSDYIRQCNNYQKDAHDMFQDNEALKGLPIGVDKKTLMELREDLLSNNVTICHLVSVISGLCNKKQQVILQSVVDEMKEYYVTSSTSSVDKLSNSDLKRLLVNEVLAINGKVMLSGAQFRNRVRDAFINLSFPNGYSDQQKLLAKIAIEFLKSQNLDASQVSNVVNQFIEDSLLPGANNTTGGRQKRQTVPNVVRPRRINFDYDAICYFLNNYAEGSTNCGSQQLAKQTATYLRCPSDCNADKITTTPAPTTAPAPPPTIARTAPPPMIFTAPPPPQVKPTLAPLVISENCGVSDAATKMAGVRSLPLMASLRIIGGSTAGDCSVYPWMVHVAVNGGLTCGGVILDETHILTAGHCAKDVTSIRVTAGEYDTRSAQDEEQVFDIDLNKGVFVHENYTTVDNFVINDIAVLKLDSPIDFNRKCVQPICLDPSRTITNGEKCVVAGWGTTVDLGARATRKLQSVQLPVFRGVDCDKNFPNKPDGFGLRNEEKQLCAGEPQVGQVDSCGGDSGSPLFCLDATSSKWTTVGLVSYGYANTCGRAGIPGVYTSVAPYASWIHEQILK